MVGDVETIRIESPDPPLVRVIAVGLKEAVGPLLIMGLTVTVRLTVALNPFRLVSVMLLVPEEPLRMLNTVGLALIVKSCTLIVSEIVAAKVLVKPVVALKTVYPPYTAI